MNPGILQAGVGLIGGGIEALLAWHQKKKLQAEADALQAQRPKWQASPYENDMLNLAESQGGIGMSDASKNAYLSQAQGGLTSTVGAIEKGGGDVNSLGNAYGKYQGGLGQLAMYDDQARQAHLANITTQYARQSANADKKFMFNDYAPWADKMQATNQQLQGATNMFQSGLNTALGGLVGGIGAAGQQSQVSNAGGGGGGSQGGGGQESGGAEMAQSNGYGNQGSQGGGNNMPYYLPQVPTIQYDNSQAPMVSPQSPIAGATDIGGSNTWGWNS